MWFSFADVLSRANYYHLRWFGAVRKFCQGQEMMEKKIRKVMSACEVRGVCGYNSLSKDLIYSIRKYAHCIQHRNMAKCMSIIITTLVPSCDT